MTVYARPARPLRRCPALRCMTLVPLDRRLCAFHALHPHPIVAAVAAEYLMRTGDLLGRDRHYPLPDARREVIRRMLRETGLSMSQIAREMGLDRTTVCYHRDAIYLEVP